NPRLGEVVDRIRTDLSYGDVIEGGLAVSGRIAWVPSPNADLRTQVVEGIDLASGRVRDRVPAVGPRFAGPVEVAFADGAVWFVDARGLVRLDPRTSDVRIVYLPGGTGIAVGGSAVWVGVRFPPDCLLPQCRGKPGYVAKVDLGARAVETTFPAADPVDVGVGGGSIWVANRQTNTV